MSDFVPGLEGVVAFETEIAEPDKEGGSLRYRGVDIEDLVGQVSFGNVWGLLVDGEFNPGPAARRAVPDPGALRRHPGRRAVRAGHARAGVGPQAAARHRRGGRPGTTSRAAAVMALSFVAQSARGQGLPMVPQREIDKAQSITERFMIRWRGEPDPKHVAAVDAYWTSAAEHGMNASTFTARVIASTGADVAAALSGAVGAMSGPLHGGAPSRVLRHDRGDRADRRRRGLRQGRARQGRAADGLRPPRLPRRGPARRGAAAHRPRTGRAALRGGRGAGEGRARRAARASPGPGAGDQRRVLGRDRARLRRGAGATCSRRCSPAPAPRAGRRTSWSRSAPAGWSGRPPGTSAPARAASRRRGVRTRCIARRRRADRPGCLARRRRPCGEWVAWAAPPRAGEAGEHSSPRAFRPPAITPADGGRSGGDIGGRPLGQGFGEEFRQVAGPDAGQLGDLGPAGEAVRQDRGVPGRPRARTGRSCSSAQATETS